MWELMLSIRAYRKESNETTFVTVLLQKLKEHFKFVRIFV